MSDFKVKIEYKNKDLETVVEKDYDFPEYAKLLNLELMRIIADIEDVFYYFTGKQKDEWDEETQKKFQHIRHKLLDQANSIKRLPQTLSYRGIVAGSVNFSEILAAKLNSEEIK